MHLRSGKLDGEPPKQKFRSAYQCYVQGKKDQHQGNSHENAAHLREEFEQLSTIQKQKYEDLFEESVLDFEKELILYYGGTKEDVKKVIAFEAIPQAPKRPITAFIGFWHKIHRQLVKEFESITQQEMNEKAKAKWDSLSLKEKTTLEDITRKEMEKFRKDMDAWNHKYGKQHAELKRFKDEKLKRHSDGNSFRYVELERPKRPIRQLIKDVVPPKHLTDTQLKVTKLEQKQVDETKIASEEEKITNEPEKKQKNRKM